MEEPPPPPTRALDVPEQQVAVAYPGDAFWHLRILIVPLGGSRYVATSSDWEVEVIDLADYVTIPLVRAATVPSRIRNGTFYCQPLDEEALEANRSEARTLATLLGVAVVTSGLASRAIWTFSDPAHPQFGEAVPDSTVSNPAAVVAKPSIALVTDDDGEWTVAERVLPSDRDEWLEEKRSGPGRDKRILPLHRDARKYRYRPLRDVMTDMTPYHRRRKRIGLSRARALARS